MFGVQGCEPILQYDWVSIQIRLKWNFFKLVSESQLSYVTKHHNV